MSSLYEIRHNNSRGRDGEFASEMVIILSNNEAEIVQCSKRKMNRKYSNEIYANQFNEFFSLHA